MTLSIEKVEEPETNHQRRVGHQVWLPGRVVPHSPWQLLAARAGVPLPPKGTPRAFKGNQGSLNGTARTSTTCPDSKLENLIQ